MLHLRLSPSFANDKHEWTIHLGQAAPAASSKQPMARHSRLVGRGLLEMVQELQVESPLISRISLCLLLCLCLFGGFWSISMGGSHSAIALLSSNMPSEMTMPQHVKAKN